MTHPPIQLPAVWVLCLAIIPPGAAQTQMPAPHTATGSVASRRGRAVAHPVSPDDAASLSAALAAYDKGDSAAAMPELERLAIKYPDNFPSNEALGLIYVDRGNFAQALPYLEHAVAAEATNAVAQANLGAAYLQMGKIHEAVGALQRAVALNAGNATAQINLGHAFFLEKQPLQAASAFAAASSLAPENVDVLYNWAVALHQGGKDSQAFTVLQRIPKARRRDAVESLWGDVAEKQGHFQEAVNHMQTAMQLNPSEPNVYALAIELLRHWTWQPATEVTQYGVEHFPQSRRLQLARGIAFYGNGRYAESATVFGALLAIDPDNEDYGSLLGRSCSSLGGAVAPQCDSLVAFAAKHPGNAQIAVFAALSILHKPNAKDELDQAEQLLRQAIRADPKLPEAYYQLSVAEQERLQWSESVANLNKAIELRPTYAEAHYRLARAYAHLHQPELANSEMALQLKYSQQEKDDSNRKLKEVTTFLVESH